MCQDRCKSNELFSRLLMFLYKEESPEVSKNLRVIAPCSTNKATFEAGWHIKVLILFFYQFISLSTFLSNTSVDLFAFTGPLDAPHRLASLPAKTEKLKSFLLLSFSESLGVSLFYLLCLLVCMLFWQKLLAWFWSYLKCVNQNKAQCFWVKYWSKHLAMVYGIVYCQEFQSDSRQKGILN